MDKTSFLFIAGQLDIDPAVVHAVYLVETAGKSGFLPDGRVRILFEPALFSRFSQGEYDESHPHISLPRWSPKYKYGNYTQQWKKFNEAEGLAGLSVAIMSCSWGAPQIIGSNYREAGCSNAREFAEKMQTKEGQLYCAVNFALSNPALMRAAQNYDWHTLARHYNGPRYKEHNYHGRLAEAYEKVKGLYA